MKNKKAGRFNVDMVECTCMEKNSDEQLFGAGEHYFDCKCKLQMYPGRKMRGKKDATMNLVNVDSVNIVGFHE